MPITRNGDTLLFSVSLTDLLHTLNRHTALDMSSAANL